MKKILAITSLSLMVWGCAKKMAPSKSETPTSNTGSVNSANTGAVTNSNSGNSSTVPVSTTNNTPSTPVGNTGKTGTKIAAEKTNSAENLALMAGQATFSAKCGRCHGFKVTTDYTEVRWVQIMQVMATKANLTETEKANVLAYVRANAKKA